MKYRTGFGAFVARQLLDANRARALADTGHRVVLIQVDYQGSNLRQRTAAELRAEQAIAAEAGLEVWWWAFCRPDSKGPGLRPGGPDALRRRLATLRDATRSTPAGFVANCEVGGGWDAAAPAGIRLIAAAARIEGMPVIGLSSHGETGPRWPIEAFDFGSPQLYRTAHVTAAWASRCLATWSRCSMLWPTLGCADKASDAAAMRADLAAIQGLGAQGALWWTARQLTGPRLAASVRTIGALT